MRLISFVLILFVFSSLAAKIAIFVLPISNSQMIFTNQIAEELANEHDVVIIRPNVNPKATSLISKHPRVREIRTAGASSEAYNEYKKSMHGFIWLRPSISTMFEVASSFSNILEEVCRDFVQNSTLIETLRQEKFDFAFSHHCDFCPISVIEAAGIPGYAFYLPIKPISMFLDYIGNPVLHAVNPSHLMDANIKMNFIERSINIVIEMMMAYFGPYYTAISTDVMFRKKFGDNFPANGKLVRKAKFLVSNAHEDIEFPLPVTSKVVYTGGLGMDNQTEPLREPYFSFVSKSKKVVFVSFGTVADPNEMPATFKQAFIQLFERNKEISFIWRMDNEVSVPENVLRGPWHPQKDLLGHPKVVAFITHAGYNSLSESIASATPLITVPLFADQPRNSQLAVHRGFAVRIDKTNVTADSLDFALHEILDNSKYEKSVRDLRDIISSSPLKPGDALRHAVNFALKYPDFDRDIPQLPFYQLYSLDIFLVVILIPLSIPLLIKCYVWSCCRMGYKEKEKLN